MTSEPHRAQVRRPVGGKALRVAVIGAGIAGLSAARTLHDHGHAVSVFEKSRGPGGRAATRRHGDVGFDHGAQYFTARDPGFRETVAAWCEAGVVAPWRPRLARLENGDMVASPDQGERFVGVPGMNALGKHLAADLQVQLQVRVAPPRFDEGRWLLEDQESNALGHFDALVVATPAPQAAELLRPEAPSLAARAAAVAYDPMWALMVEIDDDDPVGFDGVFVRDPTFSWIARNHAKPGRSGRAWVAHASADWTRSHLDATPDEAMQRLSEALAVLLKLPQNKITGLGAHRWLYSLAPAPLDVGALHDPARRLVVCGDWCQGARIEGAYQSGIAAAGRLLGRLVQDCRGTGVNDRA